ncbi:cytochrome P450 [Streptomyces sp. NPDC001584]|uniref:cytochrome P450 n=1 Tax=Streptomyces sp. NPDC001584 TaxID=3154521 RepID=UPI00332C9076
MERSAIDATDGAATEAGRTGGKNPEAAVTPVAGRDVPNAPGHRRLLGHLPLMRDGMLPMLRELGEAGPVVKLQLGPGTKYVISDGELAHEILADKTNAFGRERMARGFRPVTGDGLFTLDGTAHRERRKIVTPAFTRTPLAATTPLICQVTSDFAKRLPPRTVLELDHEMLKLSVDIAVRCLFRSEAPVDTVSWLATKAFTLSRGILLRMTAPLWLPPMRTPSGWRATRTLREVAETLSARHVPAGCGNDVLSLLDEAACPVQGEPNITRTAVIDELITFLAANSDATAMTLAWAWHELAQNRDLEHAVQSEADALFNSGRPLPDKVVEHLPLTSRVVKEVMRLYPIPVVARNTVREVTVGGFRLPPRAEVLLNLYGIHRDPTVYPHPDTFDPHRWTGDEALTTRGNAYLPFSAGAHRCVGAPFAAISAPVALAALAARFELRPAHPDRPVKAVAGVVTRPKRLLMTATPRAGFNAQQRVSDSAMVYGLPDPC